jgi:hypothetical protein
MGASRICFGPLIGGKIAPENLVRDGHEYKLKPVNPEQRRVSFL